MSTGRAAGSQHDEKTGESLPEGWTKAPATPPDWWRTPDPEPDGGSSTNATRQGNCAQLALFQDTADKD